MIDLEMPTVYHCTDEQEMHDGTGRKPDNRYYYAKSEADKVIAELKEHNEIIVSTIKNMLHKIMKQDAELRHQKYKRCLAMAKIALDDWHLHNSLYAIGHQEFEKRKCDFYKKWHKRWLELAEKFKEGK